MLKDGTQDNLNYYLQTGMFLFSIFTFFSLFFFKANYGKLYDNNKSPLSISNRIGWFIEEIPNVVITLAYLFFYSDYFKFFFILPFLIHYLHRALYFPFKLVERPISIEIIIIGCLYCCINSTMQCRSVFLFLYPNNLTVINYFGLLLFVGGMLINIYHDYAMINLKRNKGYSIPQGFLFDYVSCPNYFGEIIEWMGYALFCSTLSAYIFAFSTFCNLFPRAIDYHKWYVSKFQNEYPKNRKVIFPFIF